MEPPVEHELNLLLGYAQAVRMGIDMAEAGQLPPGATVDVELLRGTGWAYVGGTLTTLIHLGHITQAEHNEYFQRIREILGDPAGGWVAAPG